MTGTGAFVPEPSGHEQSDPTSTGPEPVRSDPADPGPVRSEPTGPEPVRSEPTGPEPVGLDPVGLEPLLVELTGALVGCLGAGISLFGRRGGRSVAAIGLAAALDPVQWTARQGPLWDAAGGDGDLLLPGPGEVLDLSRWPSLQELPQPAGAPLRGVVVALDRPIDGAPRQAAPWQAPGVGEPAPAPAVERELALCSLYLAAPPISPAQVRLEPMIRMLARLAGLVGASQSARRRADQLQEMVRYRRVIEQAKGMVMAALGVDANSAFATLTRASQHFNLRLRALAIALVEQVGGGTAEVPDAGPEPISSPDERRIATQVWAALIAPGGSPAGGGGARVP